VTDRTGLSPVILQAPHGGTAIPTGLHDAFTVDDAELPAEVFTTTDHATTRVAAPVIADCVRAAS
jgi:hypothetical protein